MMIDFILSFPPAGMTPSEKLRKGTVKRALFFQRGAYS